MLGIVGPLLASFETSPLAFFNYYFPSVVVCLKLWNVLVLASIFICLM